MADLVNIFIESKQFHERCLCQFPGLFLPRHSNCSVLSVLECPGVHDRLVVESSSLHRYMSYLAPLWTCPWRWIIRFLSSSTLSRALLPPKTHFSLPWRSRVVLDRAGPMWVKNIFEVERESGLNTASMSFSNSYSDW